MKDTYNKNSRQKALFFILVKHISTFFCITETFSTFSVNISFKITVIVTKFRHGWNASTAEKSNSKIKKIENKK